MRGKIRAIVIERAVDGKRMAIYTNGSPEEIDSERVVQLICRRWGQENLIKELLGKHFINYMPGYVREGMKEQPLVDNPQVTRLKKRRGTLSSELHTLKVQLADKILKGARDDTNWQQIKGKELPLLTEIVKRQNEMLFVDQELESLPVKLQGGGLRVRLKRFKNPEIDYAARGLCEDLDRMNPVTLDWSHLPILFEVG